MAFSYALAFKSFSAMSHMDRHSSHFCTLLEELKLFGRSSGRHGSAGVGAVNEHPLAGR